MREKTVVSVLFSVLVFTPIALAQTSSQSVLAAFLRALRTHDIERIETLSIVGSVPMLLGFEVVGWRKVESRDALLGLAAELEKQAKARRELVKREVEAVNVELDQLRKQNDQLYDNLQWGRISREEYEPANQRLETRRQELLRQKEELQEPAFQLQGEATKRRLEEGRHQLLLRKAFPSTVNRINSITKFTIQSREAIVDLQIQSKAGFRLFKKYSIVLERPIAAGQTGRWVVAEMNDLSE